jgi:hypothetical protein
MYENKNFKRDVSVRNRGILVSKTSIRMYFFLYIISIGMIFPCQLLAQKLANDSLRNKINEMVIRDQEHRKIVLGPELWKKFKSQPQSYQDSMHILMQRADSVNFIEYVEILKNYGFVDENEFHGMSLMLLHFISHKEVAVLEPLLYKEVIAGRMPPLVYARWYDRYLLQVCKKRRLYGEYFRDGKFPCVDDLETTNAARKKIGLSPFKKSKCKE